MGWKENSGWTVNQTKLSEPQIKEMRISWLLLDSDFWRQDLPLLVFWHLHHVELLWRITLITTRNSIASRAINRDWRVNELLWGHHEYSSGVGTIITYSYFIIFFLFFMHSVGLFVVVSPDLHLQAHTLYIATCAPRVRSQIFTTCTLRRLSQPSSSFLVSGGRYLSLSLAIATGMANTMVVRISHLWHRIGNGARGGGWVVLGSFSGM